MSASTIGFARLPGAVRDLLADAAGRATAAASELDTLARNPARRTAVADIVALEDDGDRIAHELQHAVASARMGREDRGNLLRAVEAIDDVLDAIEAPAHELPDASDTLSREPVVRAVAVVKDLVRTTMATLPHIEEPPAAREALHERAHELEDELRTELRTMQVAATDADDVLSAVRAAGLLRRLRSIGQACARALLAVEVLAAAHV